MAEVFSTENTEGFTGKELSTLNRAYYEIMYSKYAGKMDNKTLCDYIKEHILANCEYYIKLHGDE